jgi:hypothetical protein
MTSPDSCRIAGFTQSIEYGPAVIYIETMLCFDVLFQLLHLITMQMDDLTA